MTMPDRYSSRYFLAIILAMILSSASEVLAQVEVAPTRVLLSTRSRSQELTVHNPTSDPVEVTTSLGFKLIRSDSLGRVTLDSNATEEERRRSCREWVKIFPSRFVVQPGTSRVVRVMVMPPDSIGDGEYWGRAVFGCMPMKSVAADTTRSVAEIRTDLTMRLELDIPVIFRKGKMETGIEFEKVEARTSSDGVLALVDLKCLGNAAYRGTLTATLADGGGATIGTIEEQFTVESYLRKGLRLPRLAPGRYTMELESRSVKKGAAVDVVVQAPTVRKSYELAVDGAGITIVVKE